MSELTAPEQHVIEPETVGLVERGMPTLVSRSPEWAPEVDARLARVGTRIWIVADVFFFAAWFFAFFYLRALNNDYDWLPPGTTHPTRAIGAIIVLVVILGCARLGWGACHRVTTIDRAVLFWLALAAGIGCFGVQIYEFRNLGFDPQTGRRLPQRLRRAQGRLAVPARRGDVLAGHADRPGAPVRRRHHPSQVRGHVRQFHGVPGRDRPGVVPSPVLRLTCPRV